MTPDIAASRPAKQKVPREHQLRLDIAVLYSNSQFLSSAHNTHNGRKEHGIRSAEMRAIQHSRIGAVPMRARVGEYP